MLELRDLLERVHFGNSLWQWTVAVGVAVALLIVLLLVRRLVRMSYARLAATPQTELMELPFKIISRTTVLFLLVIAMFAGLQAVQLPDKASRVLLTVVTISVFWQTGLWATTAVVAWLERKRQITMAQDRAAVGTISIISFIARTLIWALVLLLTLDNLGVNITALVAGLGIGGIAVALAVQNVLGDLLASLTITLDRPFVIGDFLIVDEFQGTVEYIGIKSTRLRSLGGEQIIIPNANLLSSRIRNYTRMMERRVVFTLGVTYETPRDKLERIPPAIRSIVEAEQNIRFDRAHFFRFGPASLDFEVVYIVLSPDYTQYMDIQQRINLKILETFEREGVEFAYPTQRLLLERAARKPAEAEAIQDDTRQDD
jgi:small-conductance mechanosensitive channel